MSNKFLVAQVTDGNINISDDVIESIASFAAQGVEGVVELQSNLKNSVSDILKVKNAGRGIKVSVGEKEAIIDMYINVEFGSNIVEIAKKVQEEVKEKVETMTDLEVVEVNVHISGIHIKDK
ncbi:putative alkaline shock family protein YloU [Peptoniphilus koenoeneniae]|uniref:Alkaline shock family protein YloU n=1 Tax=Peptoniphilus koenoeneniae TaxID=507751 RepID=A0ABU0ASD4_9FIRM|nr:MULTISPECIES: Asp23/Gls24 family envelope stress response protein [Peptoniphilus]ERT56828.1 Asp23 family protein [Peptoniphilus sp. BV3C26]MDQ0274182.1 putative alkaline shock family protein YloU [Peptoniphilus koenoeneniae]